MRLRHGIGAQAERVAESNANRKELDRAERLYRRDRAERRMVRKEVER